MGDFARADIESIVLGEIGNEVIAVVVAEAEDFAVNIGACDGIVARPGLDCDVFACI